MKKIKSISKHKKELDTIFSLYIRIRDKGQCYTCPKKNEIKKMQNGHFIPRQYMMTRFDEINCHCQCYACNMLYNGQPSRYAQRLMQDYGKNIIDVLEQSRHKVFKPDVLWYEEQKKLYKKRIIELSTEYIF